MNNMKKIATLIAATVLTAGAVACESELDNKPAAVVKPADPAADKPAEPKTDKAAADKGAAPEATKPGAALKLDTSASKIGFVGAIAPHGFVMAHARKFTQLHIQMGFEHVSNQLLHDSHDLFFIHERSLDIYLSEFRLPVSSEVFITEALGDLVVAIHPGRHQDLFEQLG